MAVALGSGFLSIFYEAVRFQWPESYFGANDTSSYAIAISPLRYLTFRFLPVYAVCVFVAVSLKRIDSAPLLGAALVGIVHGSITLGVGLVRSVRLPPVVRRHQFPVILLRGVTFACVAAIGFAAYWSSDTLAPLIPSLHDVAVTLWTAAIAAVGGAYLLDVSRGRTSDTYALANRSRLSIPSALWELAADLAPEYDTDPRLVHAIMIAENLQRPRWFRNLERVKGLLFKSGTYGIMQVASTEPISDAASIRVALERRLSGKHIPETQGVPYPEALRTMAREWNPNPAVLSYRPDRA